MSLTFTKLFSSITESTVWCEPDATRIMWITMLAMADRRGRVFGSIPGLANRARVTLDAAKAAIETFLNPDPYSRTVTHEGRRIEPIDGGWRLLNHEKYRAIRDEESAKESKRNYINARREKEREEKISTVEHGRDNAEAYTEAESEALKSKAPAASRRARKTSMPEGFKASDAVIAWAVKNGHLPVLEVHLSHFMLVSHAKGYQYVDWDAAFMRAVKDNWAKVPAAEIPGPKKPDKFDKANQEFAVNAGERPDPETRARVAEKLKSLGKVATA